PLTPLQQEPCLPFRGPRVQGSRLAARGEIGREIEKGRTAVRPYRWALALYGRDEGFGQRDDAVLLRHIAKGDDQGGLVAELDPQLAGIGAVVEVGRVADAADIFLFNERLIAIGVRRRESHVAEEGLVGRALAELVLAADAAGRVVEVEGFLRLNSHAAR